MKDNDAEKQKHYDAKVKPYNDSIRDLLKKEAIVLNDCRQNPNEAACKLFYLSNDMLDLASNYIVLNGISRSIFNTRNEDALNEARKTIFKAFIYIENIVSGRLEAVFAEIEKELAELDSINADGKFSLLRKMGMTVSLLEDAYGENSKWKWSFVDIDARFAIIAKNLFNFKRGFAANPGDSDYKTLQYHFSLIKELLYKSAEKYHERFELSTKRPADLLSALNFLEALRKAHLLMNEKEDAEEAKRKFNSWGSAYETELKKLHLGGGR